MPIYYFDVHQKDGVATNDTVGSDFKDHASARREAEQALGEMAQDEIWTRGSTAIRISVRDELGQVIAVRAAHFLSEDFEP